MSMSPKTRTRTETARPYSSRKVRSISETPLAPRATSSGQGSNPLATGSSALLRRSDGLVYEWAHFDRQGRGARHFTAPLQRGIQVPCADDRESADIFLGFRVRAV